MGAVGQLIKLSYHCEPIDIRSTCLSLQQQKKKIMHCSCGSMITEETVEGLYRFAAGPDQCWF